MAKRHKSPSQRLRTFSSKQRRAMRTRLSEAQNWHCAHCGGPIDPDTATTDHVVPLSRGGRNVWANMVAACRACNERNGRRDNGVEADMKAPLPPGAGGAFHEAVDGVATAALASSRSGGVCSSGLGITPRQQAPMTDTKPAATVQALPGMIERVARLLAALDGHEPDDTEGGPCHMGIWLEVGEIRWTGYYCAARDLIAEMRTPTTAMRRAGAAAMFPVKSIDIFDEVWRVAFDAALAEPPA